MTLSVRESLTPAEAAAVKSLAQAEEHATGRSPLNEETRLHLVADHGGAFWHLLADSAYAGVSVAADPWIAEVTVGTGPVDAIEPLIERLESLAVGHGLAVWTHGTRSPTARVLESLRFRPLRRLLTMRRELRDRPPNVPLPAGYRVRPFVVGVDEPAWLAANAQAFVQLPDQGSWTAADLANRMAEPWFNPAGFLLAERDDGLAGFCWTKVVAGVGEIYVMAVLTAHQGRGLASPLLTCGLRYLQSQTDLVELFVDAENHAAVRLYERAGFRTTDVDVLYLAR